MRWSWILLVAAAVWVGGGMVADGDTARGLTVAAAILALAWWASPWKGGRSLTHEEVLAMPESERPVVVYWRPGCVYCARLRSALGALADEARWVNIWQDDAAAAYVRSVNDGNETVPTVVMRGIPVTNPEPAVVREHLVELH